MAQDTVEQWIEQVLDATFVSGWMTIEQSMVDAFAKTTRDWNFLHVDPVAARAAGLDGTIAHGFLTLSLLAPLRIDAAAPVIPGLKLAMNYGFDRVRMLTPVAVGKRVRGSFTTRAVEPLGSGHYRETIDVSVEIEGYERPALVASWLGYYEIGFEGEGIGT